MKRGQLAGQGQKAEGGVKAAEWLVVVGERSNCFWTKRGERKRLGPTYSGRRSKVLQQNVWKFADPELAPLSSGEI